MNDKESILIVDDDKSTRKSLSLIFEKKGYETEIVGTGREALEKAQGRFFNVALLDIKLPDMEGMELLAPLKKIHPDMVIMMITGYVSLESAVQALKEGAAAYIAKPLNMDEVLTAVREALEKQRLVMENRRLYQEVQQELAERKRMVEALRESEERYRRLVEFSPEAIAVHSQGKIIYINAAGVKLLGAISPEELIGKPIMDFVHPDDQEITKGRVRQSYGQGKATPLTEEKFIRLDGQVIDVETATVPITYHGKPATLVVTRNITERKRAEESLERRAAQLVFINDIGGKIAAVLELDSVLDRAAHLVRESFGYHHVALFTVDRERGEMVMRARSGVFAHLFPSDHRLKLNQGLVGWVGYHGERLLANNVDAEPRYVNLYPDVIPTRSELSVPIRVGEEVVGVLDVQSPQRDAFDENDVMVIETLADQIAVAIENARLYEAVRRELAERKRAEEQLRLLSSAVEQSTEGIAVTDLEGNLLFVNDAFATLHGYTPAELVGKHLSIFHTPEQMPTVEAANRQIQETGEFSGEIWHVRRDGTVFPTLMHNSLFRDEVSNAIGMIGTLRDITERKQLEAQLRQAQKMEALGSLAGGIAHDFNNLLTPIGGFAALLLRKAPEGSQQQEYLHYIEVAAERAAALTRQLRLFTRQEEGERHPIQLNSVIEETRDLLKRSISREIAIELRLESELWAVEANPSQISQVLMNLCVNARDAMPEGGTLTLETRNVTLDEEYARTVLEARPGRYVCLSVSDTGIGISPEVQARLFEPFFTTKEAGKGTGLGLAVVYGIVNGHRGFIQVYSQEGRGSTFRVYLPAIESAVEEREVEVSEMPTGTETILLVDDEEIVQALGQRVLERCGYTALMAENGVQALEVYLAHQGEIALVVLDVVMPKMGGRECLRRLRELDPQVKVLISTGYMAKGLAQELVTEGALGVVEKPFQIRDFVSTVRTALDQS